MYEYYRCRQKREKARRPNWENKDYWWDSAKETVTLYPEDILATDWEIEERKIELTEKELDTVLSETIGTHLAAQIFTDAIKKRLFGPRRDLEVRQLTPPWEGRDQFIN